MLNSMKCCEFDSTKGAYNPSCRACQLRKRRTQQQRKRRTGSSELGITVPQESVIQLRDAASELDRIRAHFAQFENLKTTPPTPESLNKVRLALDSSVGTIRRFINDAIPPPDQKLPQPIRRYRVADQPPSVGGPDYC